MAANLSLIVNLILLFAVVTAISRLMKTREKKLTHHHQPSLESADGLPNDEIIAVRKLIDELEEEPYTEQPYAHETKPQVKMENISEACDQKLADKMIVMFLLAKGDGQFAGYELLQTVLAAGLRFGEGDLFHRHQLPNGQGPVIFSLAAATTSGIFDLQNIGAFSARGLCLFMQTSGNSTIDMDRFNILYETARQLSEGLDAHLLDGERKPLTKESLTRYQRVLNGGVEFESAMIE